MEEEKGYVLIRHFIRGHLVHSRSQKRTDQRVIEIFIPKKIGFFSHKKKTSQIFLAFLTFILCNLLNIFKKNLN